MTDQGYQPNPGRPKPHPTRLCRKCSTQATTTGEFCPNCGTSYMRRGISKRKKLTVVASIVLVLLLAGGVVALAAKNSHDKTVAAAQSSAAASSSAAKARRSAAAEKSASEAAAQDAKDAADEAERTHRMFIVNALQRSVTKDAKKDVDDGILDGPIKRTDCTPLGGGDDLLDNRTGEFSCIAVTEDSADGTERGYRFSAVVNWTEGSYSWHLGD